MGKESTRTTLEALATGVLKGESKLPGLDSVHLSDIVSDARLNNCYANSGARNLGEFVALGERRLSLRNYGRLSERKLLDALLSHLSQNPTLLSPPKREYEHARLAARVIASGKPWAIVSEEEWSFFRGQLRASELRHRHLYPLAAHLKAYWPFERERGPNTDTIEKYLRYSLAELRALNGFGRRKIASYIACVIFLCGTSKLPADAAKPIRESLTTSILFAWENSKLTKNEKAVIEQRFGIHTRKHTLEEVGAMFQLTRERIRQIEKKAITKLRLSECLADAGDKLRAQKRQIWEALAGTSSHIRRNADLDQLKNNLSFEIHLAIELCADRKHRGIKRPALGDWLTDNFRHDESNWYFSEETGNTALGACDTHINPGLVDVISAL